MKVVFSGESLLKFDNGLEVQGDYRASCCEENYLDFEQMPIGTEFEDMNIKEFHKAMRIKCDGFAVKAKDGLPKWVQARSLQNGCYSELITVILRQGDDSLSCGNLEGKIKLNY